MPTALDGKQHAELIIKRLQQERGLLSHNIQLGIILVGDKPESLSYIEQKKEVGNQIDIDVKVFHFSHTISTTKLRKEISRICRMSHMRGVIIQLPLPPHINTQYILNSIIPAYDIDVLSNTLSGKIYTNQTTILPPTVASIYHLLEQYNISIQEKKVALVGTGRLIGKPLAVSLLNKKTTLLLINHTTKNPETLLKQADIVISGVGRPHSITQDMVQQDVVLIDAGYEIVNKKIVGDIHPDAFSKSSYYTPVPGGVGPLTVAMLYSNLFTLAQQQPS